MIPREAAFAESGAARIRSARSCISPLQGNRAEQGFVDAITIAPAYGVTFGLHTRIDDRVQTYLLKDRGEVHYVNATRSARSSGSSPLAASVFSGTGAKKQVANLPAPASARPPSMGGKEAWDSTQSDLPPSCRVTARSLSSKPHPARATGEFQPAQHPCRVRALAVHGPRAKRHRRQRQARAASRPWRQCGRTFGQHRIATALTWPGLWWCPYRCGRPRGYRTQTGASLV